MEAYRVVTFKASKTDTAGDLFSRAVGLMRAAGIENFTPLFYFMEFAIKTTACQRALKRYPQLENFRCPPASSQSHDSTIFSNFGPDWGMKPVDGVGGLPLEALAEIFAGIPRVYPFHMATIFIPDAPWCQSGKQIPSQGETRISPWIPEMCFVEGISIHSDWSATKRNNILAASIRTELQDDGKKVPELPSDFLELVSALGKISKVFTLGKEEGGKAGGVRADEPGKSRRVIAREIQEKYNAGMDEMITGLPLPFTLRPEPESIIYPEFKFDRPPKEIITEEFLPRGFSYRGDQSGQGVYVLEKRTSKNNIILVQFDRGSIATRLSASLTVNGLDWQVHLLIPFAPKKAQVAFDSTENFRQLIANAGAVVDHLEKTLVQELDLTFGPAPEGFDPIK